MQIEELVTVSIGIWDPVKVNYSSLLGINLSLPTAITRTLPKILQEEIIK